MSWLPFIGLVAFWVTIAQGVQLECKIDLALVVDGSKSITPEDFSKQLNFAESLVGKTKVDADSVQVAAVRFSDVPETQKPIWMFNDASNKNTGQAKLKIRSIQQAGTKTATGQALKVTRDQVFTAAGGERPSAKNIVVVLTDGKSNDGIPPGPEAKKLKEDGVTIIVVGVSASVDHAELNEIASSPSDVFLATGGFDDLTEDLSQNIIAKCCPVPEWSQWAQWTDCPGCVPQGGTDIPKKTRERMCFREGVQVASAQCKGHEGQVVDCTGLRTCEETARDPNVYCQLCSTTRWNQKGYYADPNDCRHFLHCFKKGSMWEGVIMKCPPGERFSEDILSCYTIPNPSNPCKEDPCLKSEEVQKHGFYGDATNCNRYYACSDYHSVKLCCPEGFQWNNDKKRCDGMRFCGWPEHMDCVGPAWNVTTTMMPPTIKGNLCTLFGVTRREHSDPRKYWVIVPEHKQQYEMDCPLGTKFVFAWCTCKEVIDYTTPQPEKCDCLLDLQCKEKSNMVDDSSKYNFFVEETKMMGDIKRKEDRCFCDGMSTMEVPGLQTMWLNDALCVLFWFRFDCAEIENGAVMLSNRGGLNNDEVTLEVVVREIGNPKKRAIEATLFNRVRTGRQLLIEINCDNMWHHLAMLFDGEAYTFLVDAGSREGLKKVVSAKGSLEWMAHCPWTFCHGLTAEKGAKGVFYKGFLDEVRVCRCKKTQGQVAAIISRQAVEHEPNNIPRYYIIDADRRQ